MSERNAILGVDTDSKERAFEDRRGSQARLRHAADEPGLPAGAVPLYQSRVPIITYRTDPAALESVVPEPLTWDEPLVKYEFIRVPNSTGFGDYTESGQVIPVRFNGQEGGYTHAMFLNDGPPIYGGRELWGFPKKYAQPSLGVERDTLIGTLNYGSVRIATGTMGFKHKAIDQVVVRAALEKPNYLLTIIPHVDGSPGFASWSIIASRTLS
jgi:acetoacetate decarboxylase